MEENANLKKLWKIAGFSEKMEDTWQILGIIMEDTGTWKILGTNGRYLEYSRKEWMILVIKGRYLEDSRKYRKEDTWKTLGNILEDTWKRGR